MTANTLTIELATSAALAVHRFIEGRDPDAPWSAEAAMELAFKAWLAGAQTGVAKAAEVTGPTVARTVELDIPETAEERNALADLEIMNCHGVAASAGQPPVFAMLMPPSRHTQLSPEQALVLAAWLVALADPYSKVKFAHVLRKVHNT